MTNRTSLTDDELRAKETISLIASDKVEGTPVYNADGDKLGTVERVMIDKRSGNVSFAVMSFGGFLGMGESHHPLPWGTLNYDPDKDGYVVNLSRKQLEDAPYYARGNEPEWTDPAFGRRIGDYYGIPPYGVPPR